MLKKLIKSTRIVVASLCMLLPENSAGNSIMSHSESYPEFGADYSHTQVSSNKDEDTMVKTDKAGVFFRLPVLHFIRTLFGVGAQRLRFEYFDESYREDIKDFNVSLDTGASPYFMMGFDFGLPIRNFGLGGFVHREYSVGSSINVRALEGKIGNAYSFSQRENEGFVDRIDYRSTFSDAGFSGSFVNDRLRLDAIVAHADINLKFVAKYTRPAEIMIRESHVQNEDIREGEFKHSMRGFYFKLKPSYRLGRYLVGVDGTFIRLDGSYSYSFGSSVSVLDFLRF